MRKYAAGQVLGRLTLLEHAPAAGAKNSRWKCQCDCGNIVLVRNDCMTRTRSCGCLRNERVREALRKPVGVSGQNQFISSYKWGAKNRSLSWNLSDAEALNIAAQSCHYCNAPPSIVTDLRHSENITQVGVEHSRFVSSGIDRVDNSKGYELDNVVPCCSMCNYAKRAMTYGAFVSWLKRVGIKWGVTNA